MFLDIQIIAMSYGIMTRKFYEARDVEFTHQYEDREVESKEGTNLRLDNQYFEEKE